jgi:hypothetical protein
MATIDLQKELFQLSVTFNRGVAKWENYKHPESNNFQQIVNWACWEANGNLRVVYYLDKTNVGKHYVHATIPMNGKTFEEAVFEYWSTN